MQAHEQVARMDDKQPQTGFLRIRLHHPVCFEAELNEGIQPIPDALLSSI